MDDVWQTPGTEASPLGPFEHMQGGSSDPMDVPKAVIAAIGANIVGYMMLGFAYMGFVTLFVFVLMAIIGASMAPGIMLEDETLLVIGGIVGMSVYTVGLLVVSMAIAPMMIASMLRAADRQRRGGAPVGMMDLVTQMRPRAGTIIAYYLLQSALVLAGAICFYFPALIAAAVTTFAFPIVVFEDVGAWEAVKLGWQHMRDKPGWHLPVWFLLLGTMILAEITIVGFLFMIPIMIAWQLFAYRLAFGEGGATGRGNAVG